MEAISQQQKERDKNLSTLNGAIKVLNLAKDASSICPPVHLAVVSTSAILSMIKTSLSHRPECIDLALACADVCGALERGMNGRRADQFSRPVLEAIERLTTGVAEIQGKVVKLSEQSGMSHIIHAKRDRDTVAAWKLELNRMLLVFNAEIGIHSHAPEIDRIIITEADDGRNAYPSGSSPPLSASGISAQVVASSNYLLIPSNPLQQLRDFNKTSPQFHQQLSDFLRGEEYRNLLPKLQSKDLASLVEYLDSVLFSISDHASPAFQQFLHELKRICGSEKLLPESCILSGSLLVVTLPSASGRVHEGTFRGSKVRVRRIRFLPGDDSQKVKETFHQAVAVWKHLAHRNVVPILGVTVDPFQLISVWMSDEDLTGYITNHPEADSLCLLSDVAEGLNYLHSCGMIHGNLKGQTVLVDTTSRAQIIDIGFAMCTQNPVSLHNPPAYGEYNIQWAAPETLKIPGECSKEGDIFSFAGIMIEVFTGAAPFSDRPTHVAISEILDGQRPPRLTNPILTEGLWSLMQRCWDQEPHKRPKALEVARSFNIPAWKCLISRPLSADECISQVTTLFSDTNETDAIKHLRGDDAQTFVDVIDKTLDMLVPSLQKKCLGALRKVCGQHSLLPKSAQIPHCYDRSCTPLGHGGYADVWKGELEGRPVAVKVLRVHLTSDFRKITSRFCKEVVTWRSLQHPNILPLLGVMMDDSHFAMVSDWMINGNINEFIETNIEANRFELLKDVTNGLLYMHGRAMIHGDLKGDNILINKSGRACLADFGFLTIISDHTNPSSSSSAPIGGTTRWMSPELLHPGLFGFKDSRPTKGSDCYALGMVILEVLSGQAPFAGDGGHIVMRKVIDGERPERPGVAWFTDDLWRTLEQCWLPQPGDRPTAEAVLECLEPLPATWQALPPSANGGAVRDFNDSRSTLSYCSD